MEDRGVKMGHAAVKFCVNVEANAGNIDVGEGHWFIGVKLSSHIVTSERRR